MTSAPRVEPAPPGGVAPAGGFAREMSAVFPGDGEMAARCRGFDWGATPLGPVAGWSHGLRTTVGIVLTSRQPMFLFWGPELVQLYNDAYRPSLGTDGRADRALGARGRAFWTDIWDAIGPQIAHVLATGEATWHEDQLLPIARNGRLEDVWWTYCHGPVRDDDGRIAGVLVVCQETTTRVLAERAARDARAQLEAQRAALEQSNAELRENAGDLAELAEVLQATVVERGRLLDTLAAERAQLKVIVDLAPAFVAVLRGPDHRFERTNAEYDRLVGHRVRPGMTVAEAMPEVVEQGFIALLDEVLATGVPFVGRDVPARLVRTPGGSPEERFVDLVYQALTEADGTRSGVFVHGVDVTDAVVARREVEELLGASQAARADAERTVARTGQLQALTAALARAHALDDVAAVIVDEIVAALGARTGALTVRTPDGDALALVRQVGFPPPLEARIRVQPLAATSPLTEAFRTCLPVWVATRDGPDGLDAHYPQVAAIWAGLGVGSAAFLPLVVADEAIGAMSFAFAGPRAFAPDERAFLVALGHQAALAMERARLFEAEHAARQEAEAANRGKSEFLATMSHELRTPLNAIGGYAELIELGVRGPVTAEQRTDLARIQRAQRHLLGLINGVLNYAKVDAGAVAYAVEEVALDEVLATCEALVAPQARAKRLALRYDGGDPALRARADREKVRQVVLNLLSNAVKFTELDGRITLRAGAAGAVVRVTVTDSGIGIAADQLARVFEPFVQVDARLTRTQEGTGLGLAISRDLARGMGGNLTAESTPGVGSTFTLTLPAA